MDQMKDTVCIMGRLKEGTYVCACLCMIGVFFVVLAAPILSAQPTIDCTMKQCSYNGTLYTNGIRGDFCADQDPRCGVVYFSWKQDSSHETQASALEACEKSKETQGTCKSLKDDQLEWIMYRDDTRF